jgi:hypothetical protein
MALDDQSQHSHVVFKPFTVADVNLFGSKIKIEHTQAQAFYQNLL